MSSESFYEKSERLRRARVAAREAQETAGNQKLFARLLAEEEQAHAEVASKIFAVRRPEERGFWTHEQVIAARTGKESSFDDWITSRARNETLRRQTKRMAEALERQGISAYRQGSKTSIVGLVTGEAVELTAYRSIRFLPLVAQRERRSFVNEFTYLLETDEKVRKYARYFVFTNDEPIPVGGDLRGGLDRQFAEIRLLAERSKKEWGVELLLRATEYPIAVRGDDDFRSAHLHSNLALLPTRWLGKEGWSRFLRWLHGLFPGRQIQDAGKILDASELIKYSIKPTDLDDASDEEIAWLYHETARAHIVQPFNRFADLRRALKKQRLKVIANPEKPERGMPVFRVVPVLKEERAGDDDARLRSADLPKDEAFLLGTTTPQPLFTPWLEPCVLIQNYGSKMKSECQDRLSLLQTAARRVWDEAGAPSPEDAVEIADGLKQSIEGRIVSLQRERMIKAWRKQCDHWADDSGDRDIGSTHTGYLPGEMQPERGCGSRRGVRATETPLKLTG